MATGDEKLEGIELVAFDLDNTLYDEGIWFARALDRIAPEVASRSGGNLEKIRHRFDEILLAKGKHYNQLFDDVLAEEGLDVGENLPDLLDLFAAVDGDVNLFPGVRELLDDLRRHYRLGLITSGRERVQQRKVRVLGLGKSFDRVIFSSTLPENKPGRMPFQTLADDLRVEPRKAVYIGDNPLFDFRGAGEIGMTTIRVANPEFADHICDPGWDAAIRVDRVTDVRSLLLSPDGKDG